MQLSVCTVWNNEKLILLIFYIILVDIIGITVHATEDSFVGAYYKLQDILDVFQKEQYRDNTAVWKVVKLYEALVDDVGNISQYENNHPFIAIEGNHRSRRFVVARQLARALKATNLRNPPEFMNFLKFDFKEVETRRAFYSLALYASSLEARRILPTRPVVTAGYWLDIAAFSLAKKYPTRLPDKNSSEMMWPKDLLAPDLIFYVDTPIKPQAPGYVHVSTIRPNPIKPRFSPALRSQILLKTQNFSPSKWTKQKNKPMYFQFSHESILIKDKPVLLKLEVLHKQAYYV